MITLRKITLSLLLLLSSVLSYGAVKVITIPSGEGDMTLAIREAIAEAGTGKVEIRLDGGTYFCRPDFAMQKYCTITNHGNGLKNILFNFDGLQSITIDGKGSEILCHGHLFPFLFENCSEVVVKDLTIDWDIPFLFHALVTAVNPKEEWREIKPLTDGFSWICKGGNLLFPDIDGFNYTSLGSTLPFDPVEKKVVEGALDVRSNPCRIEKRPGGVYRLYEKLRYYPPVGSILSSKGDRQHDRYAPAFDFKACSNITLSGVTLHHALGMGFLFERCQNARLLDSQIVLPEKTGRVVSTTADATHFVNCRGQILIDGCRFENMLDDASNVHGTYLEIDQILSARSVRVALKHFEQLGFHFADPGDELWFLIHPSTDRKITGKLASIRILNEKFAEFTFEQPLPEGLTAGDVLENKTWNAAYTMRNCKIRHHRARNLILSTPCKIVIENNEFSSMMNSILLGGETTYWFESGAAQDVLIRSNMFIDCAYCNPQNAILYSKPKMGERYDQNGIFTRNIRFIGNTIIGCNPSAVHLNRSEHVTVKNNRIIVKSGSQVDFSTSHVFQFQNCKDVLLKHNEIESWPSDQILSADETTRLDLKF